MNHYRLVAMALAALLASGCGTLRIFESAPASKPQAPVNVPQRVVTDSESLLAYFENLRKLNAADLAREHESARELYDASPSDANRVRYAMLLSVSGAPFYDHIRATEVLEPLLKNRDAPLHRLAFVVNANIWEQRWGHTLQQRLNQEQRLGRTLQQKLEQEQRRGEELQQKLEQEQRRGQDLLQKLDALKSLEQDLAQRKSGGGRGK